MKCQREFCSCRPWLPLNVWLHLWTHHLRFGALKKHNAPYEARTKVLARSEGCSRTLSLKQIASTHKSVCYTTERDHWFKPHFSTPALGAE
jgi:hypothetical protein